MAEINWYKGAGNRGGRVGVTIEMRGVVSISFALMNDWPEAARWVRIGILNGEMVLLPCGSLHAEGCLTVQRPRPPKRSASRIAAAIAIRKLGLFRAQTTFYPAQWRDGMIWVNLAGGDRMASRDGPTEPTPSIPSASPVPTVPSEPSVAKHPKDGDGEVESELDEETIEDQEVLVNGTGKGTCQNCIRWTKGVCRSTKGPCANQLTGAGWNCGQFFRRPTKIDEARAPSHGGRETRMTPPKRQTSRKRAKCPVSDHGGRDFPASGKGVYPHDIYGVMYLAGRGDQSRRCPGSGQRPKE